MPFINYQNTLFQLAWVVFIGHNHFVFCHRVDEHWYYYDDTNGNRRGPCPFKRISDMAVFERPGYTIERAFYIREAEKEPHRCQLLNQLYEYGIPF
jgi:hypothetical protein